MKAARKSQPVVVTKWRDIGKVANYLPKPIKMTMAAIPDLPVPSVVPFLL